MSDVTERAKFSFANLWGRARGAPLPTWFAGLCSILLALVSAGLIVLATPPFDVWPLALVGLIPFYLAVRQSSPRRALALGWLMGWVINLGGYSWGVTLLRQFAHLPAAASVGVVVAICAYQAAVFGLWAGASSLLVQRARLSWLLVAPLCLVAMEAAIPLVFKHYLAFTVWRAWPLTQAAEVGGPVAVSALIVLANLVLAENLVALWHRRAVGSAVKLGALIFVLVLGIGGLRAMQVNAARAEAPTLKVGLVQPNFGITSVEDREQHGMEYIETLRQATVELSQQGAELIIWSESSWPFLFDRTLTREFPPGHPWELRPGAKGRLLAGMLTYTFGSGSDVYNSAVLFTESGQVAGRYDKNHLVPFAEYIPFAQESPAWAEQARKQLPDWPDITPGTQPVVITDGALRIGPFICSEDLDMSYVHQVARLGPNLLVLIGSDGWFGSSAAPWQHRALATFRAIETRRDLVRDMNTGVSTIIDALGRVQLEGPLYDVPYNQPREATLLVGQVALMEGFALGPYTAQYFPWACLLGLVMGVVIARLRQSKK
jgi:apolipoprotein N-acyltransferase